MEISIKVSCGSAAEAEAVVLALNGIGTAHEKATGEKPAAAVRESAKTPVKESAGNIGKAGNDTPPFETNETSEEDIREAASALVHKKGVSSLKTLLLRYKAEKVSSVKIEDRAEFLRELREFANA